jgi:hypothetical protein
MDRVHAIRHKVLVEGQSVAFGEGEGKGVDGRRENPTTAGHRETS